ncbi:MULTISPECIES: hypothetical protein [Sorangium]|uniref:PEGA domain-containing protein n=1 Tax=Sorangium cellulosum TaxID=56 RepID=A0A4P2QM99_SORCE|nr:MULTISPECIES: hypothetical protein [Sorangium]AUX31194.1 hypothetical protein SOCE836_033220 [Sorangium cellulosum]WCQ90577.1 hypothetical protein NQZ70_03288 [Sorangium sp. Soce836]
MNFLRPRAPRAAGIALAVLAVAVALPARAEPSAADRQTARTLLIEGRKKRDAGDVAAARADFQAAHALVRAPTTGLDLARADEALGHLLEARETAYEVVHLPLGKDEPAAFTQARAAAAALVEQLDARIPSLVLRVEGASLDEIEARVDGQPIPRAALPYPRKLNPGRHEVVVTAPGFQTERREVALKEAERAPVEVRVALVPGRGPAATAGGAGHPPPESAPAEARAPVPLWAWAAGGVGLAALAGSVAFAVDHAAARDRVEQDCPGSVCDRRAYDLESMEALRARWNRSLGLSVTLGAIGLAGVGAALGGILLRPRTGDERAAGSLVPLVTPTARGVVWQGAF